MGQTVRIRVHVDGAASLDSTLARFLQDNAESPVVVQLASSLEVASPGTRLGFGGGAAPNFEVEVLGFDCSLCGAPSIGPQCLDCCPLGRCAHCGQVKQIDEGGTCSVWCQTQKVNGEMWAEEENEGPDARQFQ
jgi:hypothetical protein